MKQKKLTQAQEISRLNKVVSQLYLANITMNKSLVNISKVLTDNGFNNEEEE